MSEASGMTGGSLVSGSRSSSNKALPVLLLALAVALGVALLHGLDNTPTITEASLETTKAAQASAANETVAPPTTAAPVVRPAAQVKVLITNGTAVSGVAAKINARLQPIGYQLGTPGNTTTPTAQTSVQYVAGYEVEAKMVAKSLGLEESLVQAMAAPTPVADTQAANVVVVIGTELAATTNASTVGSSAPTGAANATGSPAATGSATGSGIGSATTAAPTTAPSVNQGLTGPLTNSNANANTSSVGTGSNANGTSNTTAHATPTTSAGGTASR